MDVLRVSIDAVVKGKKFAAEFEWEFDDATWTATKQAVEQMAVKADISVDTWTTRVLHALPKTGVTTSEQMLSIVHRVMMRPVNSWTARSPATPVRFGEFLLHARITVRGDRITIAVSGEGGELEAWQRRSATSWVQQHQGRRVFVSSSRATPSWLLTALTCLLSSDTRQLH